MATLTKVELEVLTSDASCSLRDALVAVSTPKLIIHCMDLGKEIGDVELGLKLCEFALKLATLEREFDQYIDKMVELSAQRQG